MAKKFRKISETKESKLTREEIIHQYNLAVTELWTLEEKCLQQRVRLKRYKEENQYLRQAYSELQALYKEMMMKMPSEEPPDYISLFLPVAPDI